MVSPARSVLFASLILLAGMTDAFAPVNTPSRTASPTSLQFGFLKELGLEKPSWLPDFGGKKNEEESPAPVALESEAEDPTDDVAEDAAEESAEDGSSEE